MTCGVNMQIVNFKTGKWKMIIVICVCMIKRVGLVPSDDDCMQWDE